MKSSILQFKGLYGDPSQSGFLGILFWEPLEVRSKLYNWEIEEHLHQDILQIFWIQQGNGIIKSGKNQLKFKGPCLLSIPANHMHGFSFQPDIQGDVLSISSDYVEKSLDSEPQIIQSIQEILVLENAVDDHVFQLAVQSKEQFLQEWQEENEKKSLALKAHFLLLLTHIYRLYKRQTGNMLSENKASFAYFQRFKKLVKIHLFDHWSIPAYAKELGISRIHLNRICQEINQMSAHQMIQNQLLLEAKNYLLNSAYSISEIAYLMNYKDPAYFTRVFRNATGVSPREFQKN